MQLLSHKNESEPSGIEEYLTPPPLGMRHAGLLQCLVHTDDKRPPTSALNLGKTDLDSLFLSSAFLVTVQVQNLVVNDVLHRVDELPCHRFQFECECHRAAKLLAD